MRDDRSYGTERSPLGWGGPILSLHCTCALTLDSYFTRNLNGRPNPDVGGNLLIFRASEVTYLSSGKKPCPFAMATLI